MFGVNYKYEINENKNLIKLRPTMGSLIAFTAVTILSFTVPMVALAFAVDALTPTTPDPEPPLIPEN